MGAALRGAGRPPSAYCIRMSVRCPRPAGFRFELLATDPASRAWLGRIHTRKGFIDTPAFMPVGTKATVKGVTPEQVRAGGAQILLANTFHLLLRPGPELVRQMG